MINIFRLTFNTMPKGTAQQKRYNGRTHTYFKSKSLRDTEFIFFESLYPYAPEKPSEKPIRLSLTFHFDIKDKKKWGKWKTTRPDTDNMEKLLLDCMTQAGFWLDDAQVVSKWTLKQYSASGSAAIVINYREEFDHD